ncbi:MAG: response regulator [Rubrivivax sp.]
MPPLLADAAAERIRCRHAGRRVLLAGDDESGQAVVLEWLADLELQADLAVDGYEAVDLATRTPYALALLDGDMPRLDGPATARALRSLPVQRRTPLLLLTGRPLSAADRRACREAGIDEVLAKPVDGAQLAACLLRWLDRRSLEETPVTAAPVAAGLDLQPLQPLLGLDGLDALAGLAAVGGRPEVYRRLLQVFGQTHGGDGRALQGLLQQGERAAAGRLAHRLRGAAAALGLVDIETAAAALEAALDRDAAAAMLQPLLDALTQALDQGLQRLHAALPLLDGR